MTTATGVYKGFTKNDAGYITLVIEGTGLESEAGKTTKWFNGGKVAPKTASNTQVSFEYTSKDHDNGKTYYSVKGAMKELGAPAAAQNTPAPMAQHSNNKDTSIENQVILKMAVEASIAGIKAEDVVSMFNALQPLLQPKATLAPKPVEPEDESQDIPY